MCSCPLEVDEDRWVRTLHHICPPLQHAPSYITNITHIRRHLRSPLYIILSLIGIKTNDLVSMAVNSMAETQHGQNKEGFFQLDRQWFNFK